MQNFLNSNDAAFYHITTWSSWQNIQKTGLKKGNGKGISVLRTNDERIINGVIMTQLQDDKVREENRFVLLKLSQSKNAFMPQVIKPDLVDDWTWPFHNNLKQNVHRNHIEFIKEFTIENWDEANLVDNRDREEIVNSELYEEVLNFTYEDETGLFKYGRNHKKYFVNE